MRSSALCLATALLCALPAAAQPVNRSMSVSGDAEIKVIPDRVDLYLGVETRSKDFASARRQNDELVRAVVNAPSRFGVAKEDVQTDFMQAGIEHETDGLTVRYYYVRKTINVVLRDVSKFEALLGATLDAGATHVHGIEFKTSELRKYRDEARALAVKAAMEKAHDLAAAAGRKVGPISNIYPSYGGGSWYGYGWGGGWGGRYAQQMMQNVVQDAAGSSGSAGGGTVALGRISVTASVTLNFELE